MRHRVSVIATVYNESAAIDALLDGRPIDPEQKPSLGCNIKWRS